MTVVVFTTVLAGSIHTFGAPEQTSYKAALAAELEVNASAISLQIESASVRVTNTIRSQSTSAAEDMQRELRSYTAADLSAALGITVVEVTSPSVTVVLAMEATLEASTAGDSSAHSLLGEPMLLVAAGAGVGGFAVGLLLLLWYRGRRATTGRPGRATGHVVQHAQSISSTAPAGSIKDPRLDDGRPRPQASQGVELSAGRAALQELNQLALASDRQAASARLAALSRATPAAAVPTADGAHWSAGRRDEHMHAAVPTADGAHRSAGLPTAPPPGEGGLGAVVSTCMPAPPGGGAQRSARLPDTGHGSSASPRLDARPDVRPARLPSPRGSARFCGQCGDRLAPGQRFCGVCGTQLAHAGRGAGTVVSV